MPVVRQLTTRFAFDTDKRGIKNFQDTVGGMRKLILGLGVGFAGLKLAGAAQDMELLAEQAKQFTDEVIRLDSGEIQIIGELGAAFERVKKAIPGKETTRDFLQAFIDFKQNFPKAALAQFETMFTAAGLLAKIQSKPLIDMFSALRNAAISGDFTAIADMAADLGLSEAAMENFVQQLREIDPSRVLTVKQRLDAVNKILNKMIPGWQKTAKVIEETTVSGKWQTLKANIQETTDLIAVRLGPAMQAVLDVTNQFFEDWRKGEGIVGAAIKAIRTSLIGLASALRHPGDIVENLKLGFREYVDDVRVGLKTLGLGIPKISLPSVTDAREAARGFVGEDISTGLKLLGTGLSREERVTGARELLGPEGSLTRELRGQIINISPIFNITSNDASGVRQQIVDFFTEALEAAGLPFLEMEGPPPQF